MKKLVYIYTVCALMAFSALPLTAHAQDEMPDAAPALEPMTVPLVNKEGVETGTVIFEESVGGYLLTLDFSGLTEGWHAFHIHETGDCSDLETFKSSGGHAKGAEEEKHGFKDENHRHAGDMPNIWAAADGVAKAQVFTDIPKIVLNDEDGSAFVVHEGADDYHSDPAGDAGGRVACGVIFKAAAGE